MPTDFRLNDFLGQINVNQNKTTTIEITKT